MLSLVPETSIPQLLIKFYTVKATPQFGLQKVLNLRDETLAALRMRYNSLDDLINDMSPHAFFRLSQITIQNIIRSLKLTSQRMLNSMHS